MELDEHQAEAVKEAVRNGLLVITGGPGTGKPPLSILLSSILSWRAWIFSGCTDRPGGKTHE